MILFESLVPEYFIMHQAAQINYSYIGLLVIFMFMVSALCLML